MVVFHKYLKDTNPKFVCAAVQAIGRVADANQNVASVCMGGVMHLMLCSGIGIGSGHSRSARSDAKLSHETDNAPFPQPRLQLTYGHACWRSGAAAPLDS